MIEGYDPTEPTAALLSIPIVDNGDALVDFARVAPELMLDVPRFRYRRETLMRTGLLSRLVAADASLRREGYRLLVIEGWRAPLIQRRMFMAAEKLVQERRPDLEGEALRAVVETFTAPVRDDVPPPHSTGGAVDLLLADLGGNPVDLLSPFDRSDMDAFAFAAAGLSEAATSNRRILAEALLREGVTNYASEYWHWSYGDQGWAYRDGHPHALYAALEPPGWVPDPADDIDGPLVFAEPE